jgi:hypothetical protein
MITIRKATQRALPDCRTIFAARDRFGIEAIAELQDR